MGAEELLDDVIRRRETDEEPGLHRWLLTLLERHTQAAEAAGTDLDLAALEGFARRRLLEGDAGEPLARGEIVARAQRRAREMGRPVVPPGDLASVLLEAERELAETPGPLPEEIAVRGPVAPPTGPASRVVRVFVSSTFRDMQAERDELVKRTFPQLRKLCGERGVTWGEVDLRWGITDEQSAEAKVLPICLAEIDRSRPYFIGLLGERYGWVPDEIDPELIEAEPWLREHLHHSVTELEIVHGVLRDPEMAEHAFFYLRDPAYISKIPEAERGSYTEASEELAGRLEALKEQIRRSGFPVREDYHDPQTLGELVLEDLTALIDQLYPAGSVPDPLDREAVEHEAFARSRTGVYVGRPDHLERLNTHAYGDGAPLVVLGDPGSGKSALLANWAMKWRASHPDDLVLMHFIGGTPRSSDWAAMLRRIMGELIRRSGIDQEIPDAPDALRLAFANILHMAAARGRVILILDALNQLDDREGAPDLVWLPPEIPPGVRLIVSTLPGRSLDEVLRRGWPTLEVEPLDASERTQLIDAYLAQYAKQLGPDRVSRIVSAPQTANPLYVRALLEELRVFGVYEQLDDRIGHYLAAETAGELFVKILERFEQDYERDRPGLVGDAMSLIWAARRGLTEAELQDLLGQDGERLPRAIWSPLHLAAESALVEHDGVLGFSHDYLRQAVQDRYLHTEGEHRAAHLRLSDYFDAGRETPRAVDELPWQLAEAGSWERLQDLLCDPSFFSRAWRLDEFEVHAGWARVQAHAPVRLSEAYRAVLEDDGQDWHVLWDIDTLLGAAGELEEAERLAQRLSERARGTGDEAALALALARRADLMGMRRDGRAGCLALHREVEVLCRGTGDREGLARSLTTQTGLLLMDALWGSGEVSDVLACCDDAERIYEELGDAAGRARVLLHRAQAMSLVGETEGALAALATAERTFRSAGDRLAVTLVLGARAAILREQGQFQVAASLLDEAEVISREIGDRWVLKGSLAQRALIHQQAGELDEAIVAFEEAERLCADLGDEDQMHEMGVSRARLLADRGAELVRTSQLTEALPFLEEAHGLAVRYGDDALAERIEPLLRAVQQQVGP